MNIPHLFSEYNKARQAFALNESRENADRCFSAQSAAQKAIIVPGGHMMKSGRVTKNENRAWNSWIK